MLRVFELDFAPMMGILLTMTEEPLGIRPSSSVYSEGAKWRKLRFNLVTKSSAALVQNEAPFTNNIKL